MNKWTRELFLKRFTAKVKFTKKCWWWTGSTNKDGYGNFWWQGKCYGAHVLAYEFWNGPRGKKEVHHTCENVACVNPEHLCLKTRAKHIALHVAERAEEDHYCKEGHLIAAGNRYKNGKFWRCKTCFDAKHVRKSG